MAKRKKKGAPAAVEQEAFSHNPFAALSGRTGEEVRSSDVRSEDVTEGTFGKTGPGKTGPNKTGPGKTGPGKTPKGGVATDKPPARAVLRLLRKGRGGKPVTQITHLGLSAEALKEWSRALRRELGCGAAVEGDTLVVQGDQRERLEQALKRRGVRRITKG